MACVKGSIVDDQKILSFLLDTGCELNLVSAAYVYIFYWIDLLFVLCHFVFLLLLFFIFLCHIFHNSYNFFSISFLYYTHSCLYVCFSLNIYIVNFNVTDLSRRNLQAALLPDNIFKKIIGCLSPFYFQPPACTS